MAALGAINVCLGGYRGFVAALRLSTEEDGLLALEAQFAQKTHTSSVCALAVSGDTLITGGKDETVHVYDIGARRERRTLFAHRGDVRTAALFQDSRAHEHALTGDAAGALVVWRARDWAPLKTLRAHGAPLLAAAVHPSARLALTTAADRGVLMWDLARGRAVFSAKTRDAAAEKCAWDREGDAYALAAGKAVSLAAIDGTSTRALPHDVNVSDVAFAGEGVAMGMLFTGADDGVVRVWDRRVKGVQRTGPPHERRIVGVAPVGDLVVSADVKGGLKVWDLRAGDEARLETSFGDGEVHFTCMAAAFAKSEIENVVKEPARRRRKKRSHRETAADDGNADGGNGGGGQNAARDVQGNGQNEEGGTSKKKTRRRRKKKSVVDVPIPCQNTCCGP